MAIRYVKGSVKHIYLLKPKCNYCLSSNVDSDTLTCKDCGTTTPMVYVPNKRNKKK